jgi:hypothetical protein
MPYHRRDSSKYSSQNRFLASFPSRSISARHLSAWAFVMSHSVGTFFPVSSWAVIDNPPNGFPNGRGVRPPPLRGIWHPPGSVNPKPFFVGPRFCPMD